MRPGEGHECSLHASLAAATAADYDELMGASGAAFTTTIDEATWDPIAAAPLDGETLERAARVAGVRVDRVTPPFEADMQELVVERVIEAIEAKVPPLIRGANFLSESECQQLIEMARPRLSRSEGFNVLDGTQSVSDYRTSEHMFLYKRENPLVTLIEERVVRYTGYPLDNQEGIQVVHYSPGMYYKSHHDYCDPNWSGVAGFFARGGNRVITFMMYLNTVHEGCGGETYFDMAGVSIKPDMGKACMWYNLFPNMTIDPSTKHEGRPPLEPFEKWIATIWIRERVFT